MKESYAIIVDGYSTGGEFAAQLKKWNIHCIHVQSCKIIPPVYITTFRREDYVENLVCENRDDAGELVEQLKTYNPLFAIPGAEPGVELADIISNQLNLPSNVAALSEARRNKFVMQETLAAKGLRSIPQFKSARFAEILNWALAQTAWPLVIKPLSSAGGDCVSICFSKDELQNAYDKVIRPAPNMLGLQNREVLIQQYVSGEEYVFNTVSWEGVHTLCEIWSYSHVKRGNGHIYDCASLVNWNSLAHSALLDYTRSVADSLGIRFGAMHAEVFQTQCGPVLMEAGARVMGANLPINLLSECLNGRNQATMNLLAYADKKVFLEKATAPYRVFKNFSAVFLIANKDGTLLRFNGLEKIRSLPSFGGVKLRVTPGNKIFRTVNYETSPGMIYLSHEDNQVIAEDLRIIRALENETLYELA